MQADSGRKKLKPVLLTQMCYSDWPINASEN